MVDGAANNSSTPDIISISQQKFKVTTIANSHHEQNFMYLAMIIFVGVNFLIILLVGFYLVNRIWKKNMQAAGDTEGILDNSSYSL